MSGLDAFSSLTGEPRPSLLARLSPQKEWRPDFSRRLGRELHPAASVMASTLENEASRPLSLFFGGRATFLRQRLCASVVRVILTEGGRSCQLGICDVTNFQDRGTKALLRVNAKKRAAAWAAIYESRGVTLANDLSQAEFPGPPRYGAAVPRPPAGRRPPLARGRSGRGKNRRICNARRRTDCAP